MVAIDTVDAIVAMNSIVNIDTNVVTVSTINVVNVIDTKLDVIYISTLIVS